jgi:hypothetical protein
MQSIENKFETRDMGLLVLIVLAGWLFLYHWTF